MRVADVHFADIIHFLMMGMAREGYASQQKKEMVVHMAEYSVSAGHLYKMVLDEILQRYVPKFEWNNILTKAHGGFVGGYYVGKETTQNILLVGLW